MKTLLWYFSQLHESLSESTILAIYYWRCILAPRNRDQLEKHDSDQIWNWILTRLHEYLRGSGDEDDIESADHLLDQLVDSLQRASIWYFISNSFCRVVTQQTMGIAQELDKNNYTQMSRWLSNSNFINLKCYGKNNSNLTEKSNSSDSIIANTKLNSVKATRLWSLTK